MFGSCGCHSPESGNRLYMCTRAPLAPRTPSKHSARVIAQLIQCNAASVAVMVEEKTMDGRLKLCVEGPCVCRVVARVSTPEVRMVQHRLSFQRQRSPFPSPSLRLTPVYVLHDPSYNLFLYDLE